MQGNFSIFGMFVCCRGLHADEGWVHSHTTCYLFA